MPIFNDTEHFYSVLVPFFNMLKDDPGIGPKIFSSGLVVQFIYSDPQAIITIDCPNKVIIQGEIDLKPTVSMSMSAKTAHKFWLGKLSIVIALTKREVIAKGPLPALMKLLPLIKDSYGMYAEYLKKIGMEDKITNWD
ncbi:MAG TPA: hypothetical protein PLQ76_03380 [bacterium]|nr:hypothetical protein [bacterium]